MFVLFELSLYIIKYPFGDTCIRLNLAERFAISSCRSSFLKQIKENVFTLYGTGGKQHFLWIVLLDE